MVESGFRSFIAFDFETTGLSARSKVTEIGAVKVQDGFLVARFSSLVDPGVMIEPEITRLTGITNEMVAGQPKIEALLPLFLEFTQGLPLLAHNASFDCRFLNRDAADCGLVFDNPVFDTLRYAKRVLPGLPTYRLTALTELLQIPQQTAHRAWCDAEAAARLYMILLSKERTRGVETGQMDLAAGRERD